MGAQRIPPFREKHSAMRVTAVFHGILSDWVGVSQEDVDLSQGGTLSDLMDQIGIRHGAKMPEQLWNDEHKMFHKAVWAMRGREKLANPAVMLREGDEIGFFLTLAGG